MKSTFVLRVDGVLRRTLARLRGAIALLLSAREWICPEMRPLANVIAGDAGWVATSSDPQFLLMFPGRLPRGLCRVSLRVRKAQETVQPRIYVDDGAGFSESGSQGWSLRSGDPVHAEVYLPLRARRLRFDPCETQGPFEVAQLKLVALGLWATLRFAWRERLARAARGRGWGLALRRLAGSDPDAAYQRWLVGAEPVLEDVRGAVEAHIAAFAQQPLLSVILPTWRTPPELLDRAIESVCAQVYPHWELCIADDASGDPALTRRLQAWAEREPRIRLEVCANNAGISAASNRALALASGEFVAFLDHDDELAPLALYHLAAELDRRPTLELIYTDEDKIDSRGQRCHPHFKPAWNPELLYSQNYVAHLAAYRRSRVVALGGLRSECDGSQDHDLALRFTAALDPDAIRHVPAVLYHWRALPGSTALGRDEKSYAHEAGKRALRDRFGDEPGVEVLDGMLALTYRVRLPLPQTAPSVCIIVPTRDGYAHASRCVESLMSNTRYPAFELLIVDNQSRDAQTLLWLDQCRARGGVRVRAHDEPFNFSAINNRAARSTDADVLVLLNDDTEVIAPGWLEEMVSLAIRPDVGAVGAKLYYPDDTIQHAGVALGIGGVAGHTHWRFPRAAPGYMGRLHLRHAVGAVTGACLAVERRKYLAVGGLDEEHLKIAFNDVDLCLKLAARGWRSVWTPYAELYHHESVSRGAENSPAKVERFNREADWMKQRWPAELQDDRMYHRSFSRTAQDFSMSEAPAPYRPWEGLW